MNRILLHGSLWLNVGWGDLTAFGKKIAGIFIASQMENLKKTGSQ